MKPRRKKLVLCVAGVIYVWQAVTGVAQADNAQDLLLGFDEGVAEQVALFPAMDFRRWPDDAFFEAVISQVDALSSAHASDRGSVLLDMAELYLSQMLSVEAESFIDAAAKTSWTGSVRYMALRDAVNLLKGQAIVDLDTSPLVAPTRQDRGLWLSLNGIVLGDGATLDANLRGALIGLSFQSRPVAVALLPLIAEAAVSLGDLPVSDAALELMATVPDLADKPIMHYLRGRRQEIDGNTKSALEAYFEGSRGWDIYAARARIALTDLAIADGSSGALLAARDVIAAGVGAWRGDRIELKVLERQAMVTAQLGDSVTALLAYRRILTRFPNSPEAELAKAAVGTHLDAVYKDGAAGEIGLANWIEVHHFLLPAYRFLPSFPQYSEMLADAVFDMGGIVMAITEYRQTLSILEEVQQMPGRDVDVRTLNRLHYKLAVALTSAGFWEDALASLDSFDLAAEPQALDQVNRLRVAVLAELGRDDELLRTYVANPDAANLRQWGRALFAKQDWSAAKTQYARLFAEFPEQFAVGDASYLLVAAHRAGDADLAREVVQAFPELTSSADLANLAKSLLDQPAPLTPLQQDAASSRLRSFENAIDLIQGSGL